MNEEKKLIPVTRPEQVPEDMSEEEAREFWETHEFTEEYFDNAEPPPEGVLPPIRVPSELRGAAPTAEDT